MVFKSTLLRTLSLAFVASFVLLILDACSNDMERGEQALEIGDYARAQKSFARVLDKNPKDFEARYGSALAHYGIAEEEERAGRSNALLWRNSYEEFRILWHVDSSETVRPMYSNCLFYLARATLAENPRADVMNLLAQSVKLDPTNYFSLNLQALLYESLGYKKRSEETFIYIVTKFPKFAEAYFNLGNLYWKRGDIEDAWDIWSMGLENVPQNDDLLYWTAVAEDSLKARANGDH